ncbi:MAG: IS21-like element helper ATPase IstB [Sphaerochaetaceae bacterium]|jgi:DNA replication protein DnaC
MLSKTEYEQQVSRLQKNLRKFYFSSEGVADFLDTATPRTLAFMDGFLGKELERRDARHRALLLRQAGFPNEKSLSDYDFSSVVFPSDMPKEAVEGLDFIGMKHSLVFYGVCGSGKTMLAICLGMKACCLGYAVRFYTLSQLAERLRSADKAGSLQSCLEGLRKLDLLIIDEWGYTQLDKDVAGYVFQVISDSYERKSLIVTTNLPFSQWGRVVTDEQLAAAVIDRIVHYGHLVNMGNKDWRIAHSPMNGQVISTRKEAY